MLRTLVCFFLGRWGLKQEGGNHKFALEFPRDIEDYLAEEFHHKAIIGHFIEKPTVNSHCSPFLIRAKPNSDRHRVIVDLSFPVGASVNTAIDKTNYLGSAFVLNFSTVDHTTS